MTPVVVPRSRFIVITVEIVYAEPGSQILETLELPGESTVAHAIDAALSGGLIPAQAARLDCGIWGRIASREAYLKDGDRVELYRPLVEDPREARRRHAAEGRTMASGQSD